MSCCMVPVVVGVFRLLRTTYSVHTHVVILAALVNTWGRPHTLHIMYACMSATGPVTWAAQTGESMPCRKLLCTV